MLQRAWKFAKGVRKFALARDKNGFVAKGDGYRDARQWKQAAEAYWHALDKSPYLDPIWVQYAHALKEAGELAEAEKAYRRALELAPKDWEPLLHLGHVLKLQGKFDEARAAYVAAAAIRPDNADLVREIADTPAHYALVAADHARSRGDWPAVRQFCEAVLAENPAMPAVWEQLGHAQKELGAFESAEEAYRRARQDAAGDASSLLNLGHVRKMQGDREGAISAFARAVLCSGVSGEARHELEHLAGYSSLDIETALRTAFAEAVRDGAFVAESARHELKRLFASRPYLNVDPTGAWRRHASVSGAAASARRAGKRDFIWLPNIDWGYRQQRPQQLATALGAEGNRIIYISPTIERGDDPAKLYRLIAKPASGVFEMRTRCPAPGLEGLHRGLTPAIADGLAAAIDQARVELRLQDAVLVVQHPNWVPVIERLPRLPWVYDCLDDQAAFPNAREGVKQNHDAALGRADVVLSSSQTMQAEISVKRPCFLVRNAASPEMFTPAERAPAKTPVIGYFGAIAEWFQMDWIVHCAKARPSWTFMLIGHVTSCDISEARKLANIRFVGEVPHHELPLLMQQFSVAVIPFVISRLTEVTDPVKLYEYLAGGCPVVASPLPEVIALGAPGVGIATSARQFETEIARAIAADTERARRERQSWAAEEVWVRRAETFEKVLGEALPATA